ncbi:MAG TPA: tripartite tricarboxylate transporter substrate binding protein [Burkholderiales bacterium]|nr:tripartite tricarboxylate transporter substrate binding protein [Burkholderiales bacterium]
MKRYVGAACCVGMATMASAVAAQSYPARAVRILVPFVPAGPTDINARMVAQKLTEAWGQSFVVENRGGAGGVLGTDLVAKAAPDGYTLLGANPGPLTISPSLNPKLPYDPARQLTPVILVTNTTSVLTVHPSVPARSVKELIALAKARPGKLTYGTPGIGTVSHLTWEMFGHRAGVKLLHVPYKGSAQSTNDFLAGQIDLRSFSIPAVLPLMKSGKARVIGINSLKRSPLMPDAPTVDESGLPGFESANWNGIMAPAGTPREIIMKLHDEIQRRVIKSELREQLIKDGYEIAGLGPEEFAAFMKLETEKWAKVIKTADVKID